MPLFSIQQAKKNSFSSQQDQPLLALFPTCCVFPPFARSRYLELLSILSHGSSRDVKAKATMEPGPNGFVTEGSRKKTFFKEVGLLLDYLPQIVLDDFLPWLEEELERFLHFLGSNNTLINYHSINSTWMYSHSIGHPFLGKRLEQSFIP